MGYSKFIGLSIAAVSMTILVGCGGGGGGSGSSDGKLAKATVDFNTTYVAIDFLNRGVWGVIHNFDDHHVLVRFSDKQSNAIEGTFPCSISGSYTRAVSREDGMGAELETETVKYDHCVNEEEIVDWWDLLVPWWSGYVRFSTKSVSYSARGPFEYNGEITWKFQWIEGEDDDGQVSAEVRAKNFTMKSPDHNLSAEFGYSIQVLENEKKTTVAELDGSVESLWTGGYKEGWKAENFSAKLEVTDDGNETERAWVEGRLEVLNIPFGGPEMRSVREASEEAVWFAFDDFYVEEIDYERNGTDFDRRYYEGTFGYSCMGGTMEVATPEVWDKNMSQRDLDGRYGVPGTPYIGRSTLSGAGGVEALLGFHENEDNKTFATVAIGDEEKNTTLNRIRLEAEDYCSEDESPSGP